MERKLYFGITTPGAIFTLIFGLWLLSYNFQGYLHQPWMHMKLGLVALLIVYHFYLGKLWFGFKRERNQHSHAYQYQKTECQHLDGRIFFDKAG